MISNKMKMRCCIVLFVTVYHYIARIKTAVAIYLRYLHDGRENTKKAKKDQDESHGNYQNQINFHNLRVRLFLYSVLYVFIVERVLY